MSTKYSKLAKNTVIFTVGNFATKILSFLIVPLYTYILSTEEYGRIDLFFTAGSLVTSLLTLQIHQAMMRFLLGKETRDDIALSNCMLIFILESSIAFLLFPAYAHYFHSFKLSFMFLIYITLASFNIIFSDYLLVVEKNILYACKGVVLTAVFLSSNIVALVYLKMGMEGYIFANILSQFIGCAFLIFTGEYHKKIHFSSIDLNILKEMMNYSLPLIPNSLMWWIMSSGDKFIINYFLGDGANGLYSLALKIPTIITLFYSYFIQAWVISAIEENSSEDKRQFYENIYKITTAILLIAISVISLFVRFLFTTVMEAAYHSAWQYVPTLSLATAISSQTTFFAVFYTLSKKTKNVFLTTLIGTIVNVVANFILVQFIGLQGIAIGTCIGYFVVLIIRMKDSQEYLKMDLDLKRTVFGLIIVVVQMSVNIIWRSRLYSIFGVVALISIVLLYRREIIISVEQLRIRVKQHGSLKS